jgi:hypothetical protein
MILSTTAGRVIAGLVSLSRLPGAELFTEVTPSLACGNPRLYPTGLQSRVRYLRDLALFLVFHLQPLWWRIP